MWAPARRSGGEPGGRGVRTLHTPHLRSAILPHVPPTLRTDVGGHVCHVLNRANGGTPLFDDQIDYRHFTELLAEERTHTGMRLLAWCVMTSHWHLGLWPRTDGDLGRFARRLTQRYTQFRHRRQGILGQGHLYHGR